MDLEQGDVIVRRDEKYMVVNNSGRIEKFPIYIVPTDRMAEAICYVVYETEDFGTTYYTNGSNKSHKLSDLFPLGNWRIVSKEEAEAKAPQMLSRCKLCQSKPRPPFHTTKGKSVRCSNETCPMSFVAFTMDEWIKINKE